MIWILWDVFIIQWKNPVLRCVPKEKYGARRKKYGPPRKYREKREAAEERKDSAVKVDDIELENSDRANLKLRFKIALNLTGLENSEKVERDVGNKKGFRTLSYNDYGGKMLVIRCSSFFPFLIDQQKAMTWLSRQSYNGP